MTSMLRRRGHTVCRVAFTATLVAFLAMAGVLVLSQILGVILVSPGIVTWASEALLGPCITAAVVFGLVAFVCGYVFPRDGGGDG